MVGGGDVSSLGPRRCAQVTTAEEGVEAERVGEVTGGKVHGKIR